MYRYGSHAGNREVYKSPQLSIAALDSSCIYSTVDFKAAEINNVNLLSWHWDFGNGSTISSQNGSAKYQAAGKYDVVLSAIDGHGCVDSVLRKINVIALPAVNAGNDTIICSRDIITLHPSGAAVYNWSTNSSLSCTNCANPVAHPPFSTTYYLKGSNAFGCVASDTLHVEVKQSVRLSVQKLDSLCVGKSIQLNASGAESYQWLSAESLSNLNIPNPLVSAPVTTTYTLIGSNYTGCAADTALVTVKVFPLPQFNIVDTAITVNLGTSYKMNTIGSPDIVRWLWTPPVALSCNNCPSPIVQTIGDVVYKATVSTAVGCTASDYITVHTLCNGLNLFIPNTFSPNNDGNNDWFFPRGKGEFNVRSFSVFNKLGQLVYQKNNLSVNNERDGWNGNYYGNPAPTDVYFYSIEIICSNAHTFTMKGNISLIR